MGLKDASGKVEIITNIDAFECVRLQPRNEYEISKEMSEGPLYRIITSFSMQDKADAKTAYLTRLHNGKCRIEIITAKREIEAMRAGEFKVKVDGKWVDEYEPA